MASKYLVYCHQNKINKKLYFGITKTTVQKRKQNGYTTSPKFNNAIKKYGWDAFNSFVIKDNLTKEDACNLEIYLIEKYQTTEQNNGYNIHKGGTAPEVTEEFRKKMSLISKQIRKEHPEIAKNHSKRMKEYFKTHEAPKSMLGKHHSEETKRKLSKKNKGRKISQEAYKKSEKTMFKKGQIAWNKGLSVSEETYKKMQKTMFKAGHKPWCTGLKLTEEQKEKLRTPTRKTLKKVLCVETGIIYNKVIEASTKLGISSSTIISVCKKKPHFKTAGGYHWEYV